MNRYTQSRLTQCLALMLVFSVLLNTYISPLFAQSEVEALREEISDRNDRLKEIEKEIAGYQVELKKVGGEKNSLQKTINQLELERKKVQADISYTQNKIGATDLEISKIGIEIENTEDEIALNKKAVSETLQALSEIDDDSIIQALLQYNNLSDFWNKIDELDQIRRVIRNEVDSLVSQQILLTSKHTENTTKRNNLLDLKEQYNDQNQVLVGNKTEKSV